MTTVASDQDRREQAAAGWFTIAMGLLFGGAGVVLAALAVAIDYTLKRDRQRVRGEWWRQSVADSQAWLARDREARAAWREARRQWWRDGADPAKRPAKPPLGARIGAWMRRTHARATVGADTSGGALSRFWRGFLAGWSAADKVRRSGGRFRDIAAARPTAAAAEDAPTEEEPTPTEPAQVEEPQQPTGQEDPTPAPVDEVPEQTPPDTVADGDQIQGTGDQTMTAPVGETHLDLTAQGLGGINATLAQVAEANDQLAALRLTLQAQIQEVTERVNANGGTAATAQALDEANTVVNMIGLHIGNLADASANASDQTAAAEAGLAPARDAQDALHTAGARGEFVATATS